MRAAILRNVGDTMLDVCDDVELIDPGPGDVVVDITHTGICHSDLSVMNGTIPQIFPLVLGHEGAGIVSEVGDAVTSVSVGDHVIVVCGRRRAVAASTACATRAPTCASTCSSAS